MQKTRTNRLSRKSIHNWARVVFLLIAITLITAGSRSTSAVSALSMSDAPNTAENMDHFPHIMAWGVGSDWGWPIIYNPNDPNDALYVTQLNPIVVQTLSRYQVLTVAATPALDWRPDIIPALRAANPNQKIFAIVNAFGAWCPGGGYEEKVKLYRDYFTTAMQWNTDGRPYSECPATGPAFLKYKVDNGPSVWASTAWTNINIAHQDENGHFDVADAYAHLVFRDVYQTHKVDGIYLDVVAMTVNWMIQTMTGHDVDYQDAGYTDMASFETSWTAAAQYFISTLRQLVAADGGSDFIIAANKTTSPAEMYGDLHGRMRENFPYQGGGTWNSNILGSPTEDGYLIQGGLYRQPSMSSINIYPSTTTLTTENLRLVRFGLGSAALGDGYSAVAFNAGYDYPHPPETPSLYWWFDEYAVKTNVPQSDVSFGTSSTSKSDTGWLGSALGPYHQVVLPNTASNAIVSNAGFESVGTSGNENPGWSNQLHGSGTGTMSRDTASPAVGSAAAHLVVTGTSVDTCDVQLKTNTNYHITSGLEYSATFWAKASTARTIEPFLATTTNYYYQPLPITTDWQQYQVTFYPTASGTMTSFDICLAKELGDVWVDDVQVQTGATNYYRRDFEHGIVLVNPNYDAEDISLETKFKKILGTVSPAVNDGSVVTSVTLAGSKNNNKIGDALFLLRYDAVAPGAVTDLSGQ